MPHSIGRLRRSAREAWGGAVKAGDFIDCAYPGCAARCPDAATYEAHLVDRHMLAAARAQSIARGGPLPGEWGPRQVADREGPAITCPRCPNAYPRRVQLAQHLIETHGLGSTQALTAAQEAEKAQQGTESEVKETTMAKKRAPRTCVTCGQQGHDRRVCGQKTKAGGDEKPAAEGRRAKKPGQGKATRKAAPALNGHVADNGARATAKTLLSQLTALRARLDDKIGHVRELVEVL